MQLGLDPVGGRSQPKRGEPDTGNSEEKSNLPYSGLIVTKPGNLKCKYLIHAIGFGFIKDFDYLQSTIIKILDKASTLKGVRSISIPAEISSIIGYHSFNRKKCAELIIQTVIDWMRDNGERPENRI